MTLTTLFRPLWTITKWS